VKGVLAREREREEGGWEGRAACGIPLSLKEKKNAAISSVWVHERGVMCCAHTLDTYANLDLTAAGLAGRWT
jgi:hypothetical protein